MKKAQFSSRSLVISMAFILIVCLLFGTITRALDELNSSSNSSDNSTIPPAENITFPEVPTLPLENQTANQTEDVTLPSEENPPSINDSIVSVNDSIAKNKTIISLMESQEKDNPFLFGVLATLAGDGLYNSTNTNITLKTGYSYLNISSSSPYDSLAAYWSFDKDAQDLTNFGRDGTSTGAVFNATGGLFAGGALFDGNDQISVNSFDTPGITVSAWVKINRLNAGGSGTVIQRDDITNRDWALFSENNNDAPAFAIFTGNTNYQAGNNAADVLTLGVWYHLVGSYDGETVRLYINGTEIRNDTTPSGALDQDPANIIIGAYPSSQHNINGTIDELMVFNTSLSSAQILAIYNNQSSRFASQGQQVFQNINLYGNTTVRVSLRNCSSIMGSQLSMNFNNGPDVNFTSCNVTGYGVPGSRTNANLTIKYSAGTNQFYSPLVIGNITITESTSTGAGTSGNPYNITNCVELQAINTSGGYLYWQLQNNIDCSDTVNWNQNATTGAYMGFQPINFGMGQIYGNGYTISNLYINKSADFSSLLGHAATSNSVYITNLNMLNVTVYGANYVAGLLGRDAYGLDYNTGLLNITVSGRVFGTDYVGLVAGDGSGTVTYSAISSSGNVTCIGTYCGGAYGSGSSLGTQNSSSSATVNGVNCVGGLAGVVPGYDNYNIYATGNVNGTDQVGGLFGCGVSITVPAQRAYATGNVSGRDSVGGLVGYSDHDQAFTTNNTYATGSVTGRDYVGGLYGRNTLSNNAAVNIQNSYATGNVSGRNYVGGLVGIAAGSVANTNTSNCFSTGFVNGTGTPVGGFIGSVGTKVTIVNDYYNDRVGMPSSCNGTGTLGTNGNCTKINNNIPYFQGDIYPTTAPFNYWGFHQFWSENVGTFPTIRLLGHAGNVILNGLGSSASPYNVSDCYELQAINKSMSAVYKLINNVDCSDTSDWYNGQGFIPIGDASTVFSGVILGNNYTISNLFINRTITYVGFIGFARNAMLDKINLVNASISGSMTTSYVGSLLGATDTLTTINGSSSAGTIRGSVAGGLVGNGGGGAILNIYNSSSTARIVGDYAGGLVGTAAGSIYNSYATGFVTGGSNGNVGGLAGSCNGAGIISNCYATGNVSGGIDGTGGLIGKPSCALINNSYATGNVSATNQLGGLVGMLDAGIISNCYATGNVAGTNWVGGLIGYLRGGTSAPKIYDSYATGNVSGAQAIGGFVGYFTSSGASIVNSYASGNVFCNSQYCGGFAGQAENNGFINNSFSTGGVSVPVNNGAFAGYATGKFTLTNVYFDNRTETPGYCFINSTAKYNTGCTAIANNKGYFKDDVYPIKAPFNNWSFYSIWQEKTSDYPKLTYQNLGGRVLSGLGTTGNPYNITDCSELQAMNNSWSSVYQLTSNIDCNDTRNWNNGAGFIPIGTVAPWFTGSLYGNGYNISNLYVNTSLQYAGGIFGIINTAGGITNLGLINISITNNAASSRCGGLLSEKDAGTIINVSTNGTVTASSGAYVGGLIGFNYGGIISNSYSTASVSGTGYIGGFAGSNGNGGGTINQSYATGNVSGANYAGGFVGYITNGVYNSYSTGSVRGSSTGVGGFVGVLTSVVSNCYSTGNVSSTADIVGGFAGYGTSGTQISNCYSTGNASGTTRIGGFVGEIDAVAWINNSYATGKASGTGSVGGFIGYNYQSAVYNSYYNNQTGTSAICSGTDNAVVASQCTAIQNNQSYFYNNVYELNSPMNIWDFTRIWGANWGLSYPALRWTGVGFFNMPPQNLSVAINSTNSNNLTIGNLSGSVSGAYDLDGPNSITYNYSWYRNGLLNATAGNATIINTSLLQGGENWSVCIAAYDGQNFSSTVCSANLTVFADTVAPWFVINFPENGSNIALQNNNVTLNFTIYDNYIQNLNCTIYVNGTFNYANLTITNGTTSTSNLTSLPLANYFWNLSCTDPSGNMNSTVNTFSVVNLAPNITNIAYSPNSSELVDPGITIFFNASVNDTVFNVSTVILQYNDGSSWYNSTMYNITHLIYTTNVTLSSQEKNYTFNIWANNSLNIVGTTTNRTFQSKWDCTWDSFPVALGATAGFEESKQIGTITINNTGDLQFANNNCSLGFRFSYVTGFNISVDGDNSNGVTIYTLAAKANRTFKVNATFADGSVREDSLNISITEPYVRSDTYQRNHTATLVTTSGGPYLYETISSSPREIFLRENDFSLEAYVQNLVGDNTLNNTAFNITFNWTLPSGFTIIAGNQSADYGNFSNQTKHYNNINISLTAANLPNMAPGSTAIQINAGGYNSSGDRIVHSNNRTTITSSELIFLSCYNVSDGILVSACGSLDGDYVAPVTTITNTVPGAGGGGGGGGTTEKALSRADYQLVRGQQNEITTIFKNKAQSQNLTNLKFTVSGNIAKYIEVIPSSLKSLGPGEEVKITLRITSPTYIQIGRQEIILNIQGSYPDRLYEENRKIVVEIHELSGEEAARMLNQSADLIQKLELLNISVKRLIVLLNESRIEIAVFNYEKVRDNYYIIRQAYSDVITTLNLISELEKQIVLAKAKKIDVSEAERTLQLAKIALEREDYATALKRMKEAQVTFAVETKGEFGSLVYFIKTNAKEILIGAFLLILLSFVAYKTTRLQLIKRRIAKLKNEEKILIELMKAVQKATFSDNAMSMEEYEQAMIGYEKRMAESIEDLIDLESKRINALKIGGEKSRLKNEKQRVVELIKQLQTDYMEKGKMETHAYQLRLESYNKRIGEIEEKMATIEAESAMNKRSGFIKSFFLGGKK